MDKSRFDYPNIPAYLIFDQSTVERFGEFGGAAGEAAPDWLSRADTLSELAFILGISNSEQVGATVKRFNENAAGGVDPDFGRGTSAFDRFPGGRTLDPDSPLSTLGPIDEPPFYGRPDRILDSGDERRTAH
jgi:3-oxosteroid 1-dehydrogenase